MLQRCNKLRVMTEHAPQHGHHAIGLLHKARRLREHHHVTVIALRKQPGAGNGIGNATIQIFASLNSHGARCHGNRRRGPNPLDIALVAISLATGGKLSIAQAITLGAIATATAPAATLMVVRQYKAKGPLVDLLLPIVALDDAVGLVVFAVSFGIAKALNTGSFDVISIVVDPLIEIVCSLALGALGGWVLTQLEKLFNSNTNRLNMTIAFVFLTTALAMAEFKIGPVTIGFSSLLTCMMLGTLFCNLCPLSGEIMEKADRWTSPLFAAFFVISGAGLDLGVFKDGVIVLIGVVYILTRSLGKYLGAHYSAKLMKCEPQICKYLGITLLPQAGVALGMCVTARQLGAEGDLIRNITLFAILIYELVGPLLTKMALQAAGEIHPMEDAVKNRRQINLEKANAGKK